MTSPYARLTAAKRWINLVTYIIMLAGIGIIVSPLLVRPNTLEILMPFITAGIAMVTLGAIFSGLAAILFKIEANAYRAYEVMLETKDLQETQAQMLTTIRNNSQISDATKSITHRDLERDALRKAIREDIVREDWEAAYNLIEEMENRFGYRLEAYNYRKDVDEFRANVIEDKLQTSLRQIRQLLGKHLWDDAAAETERLLKLAPKDTRVAEVISELNTKKDEAKQKLLLEWQAAVEKKDIDLAIQLIKTIDPFLTREEVAKLEESARSVFKAKLLDYAAQFRAAVTEKRWTDAIHIGKQIRTEFPNSLMAKEVGESMEALTAKASKVTTSAN